MQLRPVSLMPVHPYTKPSVKPQVRMGAFVVNTITGGVSAHDTLWVRGDRTKTVENTQTFPLPQIAQNPHLHGQFSHSEVVPPLTKEGYPKFYTERVKMSHNLYIPKNCPVPSGKFYANNPLTFLKDSSTLTPSDRTLVLKSILYTQPMNQTMHHTLTTGMDTAASMGALTSFFSLLSKRHVLSVGYQPVHHPKGSDAVANRQYAHYLAASDDFHFGGSYLVLAEPHLGAKIFSGVRLSHLGCKPSKLYERDYFGGARASEIGQITPDGRITVCEPYRKTYQALINNPKVLQYEKELLRFYQLLSHDKKEAIQLPHVQEWRVTPQTSQETLHMIEQALLAEKAKHPKQLATVLYSSSVLPPRAGMLDATEITTANRHLEQLKMFCVKHEIPYHVMFEKGTLPMMPAAATSKLQLLTTMAYALHPDADYVTHQTYIQQWMNTDLRGESKVTALEATQQFPTRHMHPDAPLLIGNTSVTAEQVMAYRPYLLKHKQPLTIIGMGNGHLPVVGDSIETQIAEGCKISGHEALWKDFKQHHKTFKLPDFIKFATHHEPESVGTIVASSHPLLGALRELIQEGIPVQMLPGPTREVRSDLTAYAPGQLLQAIGVTTPVIK